jgi:NAD(P)-dependent dehydrogenase (short-subunit alcohol dehydrogenase family)
MNASGSSPLSGRHALVTGASRGIGAAIVRRLAADGAIVSLVGRQRAPLEDLAADLSGSAKASVISCDVSDGEAVARAWREARSINGAIHILVNNAGQAISAPLGRTTNGLWQQMMAVNLNGTFYGCREVLPDMLEGHWGRIINIASTAGQRGYAYVGAYVAAKHGVVGLTRSLALEVAAKGITVNAVCPGYTDTELLGASVSNVMAKTGRSEDQARSEFARHNPQGRLIRPEEVADAVAWLCSSGAASINGQSISVSGGEVM